MKKSAILALTLTAASLGAQALMGIKYRGEVKMEGGPQQKQEAREMSAEDKEMARKLGLPTGDGAMGFLFEVMADSGKFRMNYLSDFFMFPKGSYMLGDNTGKVAYFVYPDRREYVEMNLDEMQNAANQMGQSMKITYSDQQVEVSPLPPKVVSGVPCTGKRIRLAYTTEAKVMGFKTKSRTEDVTDYYTTTAYDVLAIFGERNWHSQGLVTGDPAFDKVVAAKVGFLGFPMEVRTKHFVDGKDNGTSILTTKDVQMAAIPPGTFVLPAGYTKTELGLGSMMKGLTQMNDEANRNAGQSAEASGEEGEQVQPQQQSQEEQKKKKPSLKDLMKVLGK
ncbi:MAG: hypothetical protein ACOYXN_03680 [Acidobacteriota bacterium]